MLLRENTVGGSMIVYDVYDAFHAMVVDCIHKMSKILCCSKFRIYRAVIPDRVRRPQTALPVFHATRMNRHQPDDICSQCLDPGKVPTNRVKGTFFAVVSYKNGINHIIS